MISFKNKKILITGATGGIGNELVKKLLYLHKKKNLIKKLKKNTKSISKKKLVNWDQRIKQETDIFKKLALV